MIKPNVHRAFGRIIYNKNTAPKIAFHQMKEVYSFSEQCLILERLPNKNRNTLYTQGIPLPETLSELGKAPYIHPASTFQKEVNWLLLSIRKHNKKLNHFLEKKSDFEHALLKGKYLEALEILDYIENNISYSLWGIENKFIIFQELGGLAKNKKYLNDIKEENNDSFVNFLAYFFSLKADSNISLFKYHNTLESSLKNTRDDIKQYVYFKANIPKFESKKNLSTLILSHESPNSLIDRYLTLIRLTQIQLISFKSNDVPDTFINISYLDRKVIDSSLKKIKLVLTPEEHFRLSPLEKEVLEIDNFFVKGNYEDCIEKSLILLERYPSTFKIYELYVKSLVYIGLSNDNNLNNIQTKVLNCLHLLLTSHNDSDINDVTNELHKIALKLSCQDFSLAIFNFLDKIQNGFTVGIGTIDVLASKAIDSEFIELFNEEKNKILILDEIKEHEPHLELIDLQLAFYSNTLKDYFSKSSFPQVSMQYWIGTKHFKDKQFDEAKNYYLPLLQENLPPFMEANVVLKILYILIKTDKLSSGIRIISDYYFRHNGISSSLKTNARVLLEKIKFKKFKNIDHNIDLPIFFYIVGAREQDIHTSCELFVVHNKQELPKDIDFDNSGITKEKIVFFLNKICTAQVYRHSPFILNDKNRLLERISICNYLIQLDTENGSEYKKEIEDINKKLIIQEGLKDIDESKIYIDEVSIIKNELEEVKESFQNYTKIQKLSKNIDFKILVLDLPDGLETLSKDKSKNLNFATDPLYGLFEEMFLDIRNKFLSSDVGLVAYLSTRIRHGIFMGELRPIFSNLNLITVKSKNDNNQYLENKYWKEKYQVLDSNKKNHIQDLLAHFSTDIDNLINTIVKVHLQIKTEINTDNKGWFDYQFKKIDLTFLYLNTSKNQDYESFVKTSLEYLWKRTEQNLEIIRKNFYNHLKKDFVGLIENLEKELRLTLKSGELPELFTNINSCKSAISTKLDKIARWFILSDKQIPDFHLDKVIDTSIATLTKSLNLSKEVKCQLLINGNFFVHLVDLICIFFNNIIKYATSSNSDIHSDIKLTHSKTNIEIKIKNSLFAETSVSELKNEIDSRLSLLAEENMNNDLLRTEGKSGFVKAKKILERDLKNDKNSMVINISEEFGFEVILNISLKEIIA